MRSQAGPLTLTDILAEEDLGLELVVGDLEAARERPVLGVHTFEISRPGDWVEADWLILMTGASIRYDEDTAETIVRELSDAGVAALGFGLKPFFDEIPPAVLDAAARHGLPVISVPVGTPFREVTERVIRSLLSEDLLGAQRLMAMQRYLMDALGQELPQRTAIERLAALLGGEIALLDQAGRVVEQTGPVPEAELRAAMEARRAMQFDVVIDGKTWLGASIAGLPQGWVVASFSSATSRHFAKAGLQAIVPLLTAIARLAKAQLTQRRAARQAIFDELAATGPSRALTAQLHHLGIDEANGLTVAAISNAAGRADDALQHTVEGILEDRGAPYVARRSADRVMVLHGGSADVVAGAFAAVLDLASTPLRIGLGDTVRRLDAVSRCSREAEFACAFAVSHAREGVVWFASQPAGSAILAEVPLDRLVPHAEKLFDHLNDLQPTSEETLRVLFANDMSITRTAQDLHLHANSLRYRLARIEEEIGGSIREPRLISLLYLALRARSTGPEVGLPHVAPDAPTG